MKLWITIFPIANCSHNRSMTITPSTCDGGSLAEFVSDARLVTVRTHTHPSVSLAAVLIGDDFIAGINEATGLFTCYRLSNVHSLIVNQSEGQALPLRRIQPTSLLQLLTNLPTPFQLQIAGETISVREIAGEWLLLVGEGRRAISFSGLNDFALLEAPDSLMFEEAA